MPATVGDSNPDLPYPGSSQWDQVDGIIILLALTLLEELLFKSKYPIGLQSDISDRVQYLIKKYGG